MPPHAPIRQSTHVCCRHYHVILPGWLPVAKAPHATLLMDRLQWCYPAEFRPMLQRMATEDIGPVVMEAFVRVEPTAPQGDRPCA
jgi:hypothetical protein